MNRVAGQQARALGIAGAATIRESWAMALSTGSMFTCGVTTANVGYCWGVPLHETGSTVPTKIPGPP